MTFVCQQPYGTIIYTFTFMGNRTTLANPPSAPESPNASYLLVMPGSQDLCDAQEFPIMPFFTGPTLTQAGSALQLLAVPCGLQMPQGGLGRKSLKLYHVDSTDRQTGPGRQAQYNEASWASWDI